MCTLSLDASTDLGEALALLLPDLDFEWSQLEGELGSLVYEIGTIQFAVIDPGEALGRLLDFVVQLSDEPSILLLDGGMASVEIIHRDGLPS